MAATYVLSDRMCVSVLYYWQPFILIEESCRQVTLCMVEQDLPAIAYLASCLSRDDGGTRIEKSIRSRDGLVTWKVARLPGNDSVCLTFTWAHDTCVTLVFAAAEWTAFTQHLPEIQKSLRVENRMSCPPDMMCEVQPEKLQVFHFRLIDGYNDEIVLQSSYPSLSYDECMTRASRLALRFQYNTLIFPALELHACTELIDVPRRGQLLRCSATYLIRRFLARMRSKFDVSGFAYFTDEEILKMSNPKLSSAFLAGMTAFVQAELKIPTDGWLLIAAEMLLQSIAPVDFFGMNHNDTYDVFFTEYLETKCEFTS